MHDGRTILYRASTRHCGPCPLKPKCTPNVTFRKIPRDVHEDARDATRALMGTPEFAKSRNERKKVEMRFAHVKTHHGFERINAYFSLFSSTSTAQIFPDSAGPFIVSILLTFGTTMAPGVL